MYLEHEQEEHIFFYRQTERSMAAFRQFLSTTQLQHLELVGARINISVPDGPLARLSRQDDLAAALTAAVPPLTNDTVAFLNLDNVEVSIYNHVRA